MKFLILLLLFIFLFSCKNESKQSLDKNISNILIENSLLGDSLLKERANHINDSLHFCLANSQRKKSTIRFENFTVLIYDFDPFESEYGDSIERRNEKIIHEKQIIRKDTVLFSEDLDQRFNNSLLQIIPKNNKDIFKMTFCYLTRVYELISNITLSDDETEQLYANSNTYKDKTKPIQIKDSSGLYFYLVPHTSDMESITVKNGKIVPVHERNTDKQNALEEKAIAQELKRIKKKYQLKDTNVVMDDEYQTIARFTGNKKLYDYVYDAFFIRIDRFNQQGILLESKYIQIDIQYGC
jgi:hypothetical protein